MTFLVLGQSGEAPLTFNVLGRAYSDMDENQHLDNGARSSAARDNAQEPAVVENEIPTSDGSALGQKARAGMRAGRLPTQLPEGVWGGPGCDAICAVCSSLVQRDGLGFEFEVRHSDGKAEIRHVHIPCFVAWQRESGHILQAGDEGFTIPDCERGE